MLNLTNNLLMVKVASPQHQVNVSVTKANFWGYAAQKKWYEFCTDNFGAPSS